ncbi:MAG: acyl-CoA dehydrogenase [Betaproteobacteria bacterium]|nr:acyl-CoA dehydrogenase [Betaproteobacteria bacterium]
MSDSTLLQDAVSRVFLDFYRNDRLNKARQEGWCTELWKALEQTGMTLVSVPESLGGSGGSVVEAAEILRLSGKYCAAVPLAETALLAGWALAAQGIALPQGPLAFGIVQGRDQLRVDRNDGAWEISGYVDPVPYARHASAVVLVARIGAGSKVICAPASTYRVHPHANLAGEARDRIVFDEDALDDWRVSDAESSVTVEQALQRGALARAVQMSGALERILEMTTEYARHRAQFGRPIIKFQAVQQELARLAGEAAIAKASAMAAAASVQANDRAEMAVAFAKIRAGEAAQAGASIAHQLHGAIGVTDEYLLHHSTLRLWAWRSEYGSEAVWADKLGRHALDRGSAKLWAEITGSVRDPR